MTERYVRMNILTSGGEKAKATLDDLAMRARKMEAESPELKINANDSDATRKIKDLRLKLEILKNERAEVYLEAKGDEKVKAKILDIRAKLDELSKKAADPKIELRDADKVEAQAIRIKLLLDSIHNRNVDLKVAADKKSLEELKSLQERLTLRNLFTHPLKIRVGGSGGAGGGGGEGGTAGEGGLPTAPGWLGFLQQMARNPFGLAALGGVGGGVLGLVPSLLGLGVGGGIGGLGLMAALREHKPFAMQFGNLGASIKNILGFGTAPIASAFEKMIPAIDKMATSMEIPLRKMFTASIPFIKAFLGLLEQGAKIFIPAFTQTMNSMARSGALKIMMQGLVVLMKALAQFLIILGPDMRTSAEIFNGVMKGIGAIILVVGIAIRGLIDIWRIAAGFIGTAVKVIAGLVTGNFGAAGRAIGAFGHMVRDVWDHFRHDAADALGHVGLDLDKFGHLIAHDFDNIRHYVAHVWDSTWNDTIGSFIRFAQNDANAMDRLRHNIANSFDNIRHDVARLWDELWTGIGDRLRTGVTNGLDTLRNFGHQIASNFDNLRHSVANAWDTMWNDVKRMTGTAVHAVGVAIHGIEGAFRTPIAFVVNDVWDKLAGIWNHIAGIVHLSSLKLPIAHMAEGGVVPGHGKGDTVPAMLTPGERVLSIDQVDRLGGHRAIDQAVGRGTGGPFHFAGGGIVGGILGGIGNLFKHIGQDLLGWITKPLSFVISHLFSSVLGLLPKIPGVSPAMNTIMKTLTMNLAHGLALAFQNQGKSQASSGFGSGGAATPGLITVAKYIMAHGGSRAAGAGVGGTVAGESMGNPEAIEAGGGGGTGILQWTPGSSAFPIQPIVTGNPRRDMGVQLVDMMAYIASRGGIGAINRGGVAGGPMGAAQVFSAMEAPAVPGSDIRRDIVMSLYARGLANGGWITEPIIGRGLRSGMSYSLGETGPEYVTPANRMSGRGGGDTYIINIDANLETTATAQTIVTAIRQLKRKRGMREPTPTGQLGIA